MTGSPSMPPATPDKPLRLAVLLSGSGRTLDNLLDWIAAGRLSARVEHVVASRGDVRGVRIARRAGIP
ncbi:MAG: phosphoribosylglycinamide formyltransferase, partial [Planctomycetia bacterium]